MVVPGAEPPSVPEREVLALAQREGVVAFEVPGAELPHFKEGVHEHVTFDAILWRYGLTDPAFLGLTKTVRIAGGGSGDEPEALGPEAAATGFRRRSKDDIEDPREPFPIYSALYACRAWKLEEDGRLEHTGR